MNDIGNLIKHARIERGLSQVELGEAIGITKSTISKYELGHRKPSFEQIQAIAAALGVHPGVLMGYVFLGKTDDGSDFYGPSPQKARADTAMDQMSEEGRGKVADYAEDILPRYRRSDGPAPQSEGTATPSEETPTEDA